MVWAIGLIGAFSLMTIALGLGACAVVGPDGVRDSGQGGNTAVPLLAVELGGGAAFTGGTVLFAVVGAVVFAITLTVVAGVTLASSACVAHDLYASPRREHRGAKRRENQEVTVARVAAIGLGAAAIGLSLLAQGQNVAFLMGLAFAVAASANLPALLYSLFWRRFTARGALWAVYGGLIPAVVLVIVSPVVSAARARSSPGSTSISSHCRTRVWSPSRPVSSRAGWEPSSRPSPTRTMRRATPRPRCGR